MGLPADRDSRSKGTHAPSPLDSRKDSKNALLTDSREVDTLDGEDTIKGRIRMILALANVPQR